MTRRQSFFIRALSIFALLLQGQVSFAEAPAGPALALQTPHGGFITRVATSPDGRILATLGGNALKLWDLSSGFQLRDVALPLCDYSRLSYLPSGREVMVGGACNYSSLDIFIDLATGSLRSVKVQRDTDPSYPSAYSPNGTQLTLVGQSKDGYSRQHMVYRLSDGKPLSALPGKVGLGEKLRWLPDDSLFVFSERHWDLLDPANPSMRTRLVGGDDQSAPILSPDRKTIAFIQGRTSIRLQQGDKIVGEMAPVFRGRTPYLYSLAYSADGKRLYAIGAPGPNDPIFVASFDLEQKKQLALTPLMSDGRGSGVATTSAWFINGNTQIVATSLKNELFVWDTASANLQRKLAPESLSLDRIAFSPDGRFVAHNRSSYGRPALIQVWDLALGRIVRSATGEGRGNTLAFTPDGKSVAWSEGPWGIGGSYYGVKLLNLASGEKTQVLKEHAVDSFAFSPDGRWLAISARVPGDDAFASRLKVFDRASGNEVAAFAGSKAIFSQDSKRMLVADSLGAKKGALIYIANWKAIKGFEGGALYASADLGRVVTAATYGGGQVSPVAMEVKKTKDLPPYFSAPSQVHDLSFAADNGRLAIGGAGFGVLLDPVTRKTIRNLVDEHPVELMATAFSRDGRWLATGGQEGALVLRNALTGLPEVTLLAGDEQEGVAVLPSGEYLASRGALNKVAFRVGMRAYPFDQFDLKFNRPDSVLKVLGKASASHIEAAARARVKRLARAGFTEDMLAADFHLPEVTVERQNLPASTKAASIKLPIRAVDTRVPLERLLVSVNEVPFDGVVGGIALKAERSQSMRREVEVPILPGRNRIAVSVLNAQGVESLREVVEITGEGAPKPGKVFVLAIGVSAYQNPAMNLQYAAKDAKDVAAIFGNAQRTGGTEITTVLDAAATREGIRAAKAKLLTAEPNDQVVLFVAGHGLLDDSLDYYFATTDIDIEKPSARGLGFDELEGLLDGVKARRKLMLVDTCNSGELDKTEVDAQQVAAASADTRVKVRAVGSRALKKKASLSLGDLSGLLADLFADTRRGTGAVVISSAGGAEFALESDEWKNGVFTFAMLEGLKTGTADKDRNGSVTVSELRDLVQGRVRKLTNGAQSPTARRENLVVDFVVY